jgi:hypothetical protein
MEHRVLEEMATFVEVISGTACTITIPYDMFLPPETDVVLNTHKSAAFHLPVVRPMPIALRRGNPDNNTRANVKRIQCQRDTDDTVPFHSILTGCDP